MTDPWVMVIMWSVKSNCIIGVAVDTNIVKQMPNSMSMKIVQNFLSMAWTWIFIKSIDFILALDIVVNRNDILSIDFWQYWDFLLLWRIISSKHFKWFMNTTKSRQVFKVCKMFMPWSRKLKSFNMTDKNQTLPKIIKISATF